MPIIKIKDATWLARETDRIKAVLLGELPRAGLPVEQVRKLLEERGFNHTAAEYQAIAQALIAQNIIEIVP